MPGRIAASVPDTPMTDRLETLRRMLESEPNDAFCLYALGMEHVSRGDMQAGEAHLALSLASDPDQPYAHFHRARCLAALGRSSDARIAVDEGLTVAESTGDAQALSELASLRTELT